MRHKFRIRIVVLIVSLCSLDVTLAQQIAVPRIEMMPNLPAPYEMRNWKQVAAGYDSLVFDFNRSGQYLPLIWRITNTVNYPNHESFGLHTVVGTPRQNFSEAINVLPAVIGATLVGIDKSNQHGENWVLFCEEYFNRRAEENIYLNHPVAHSGDDWWYETMPNLFFYQLYDLYPNTGDFANQFTTIADQWLRAVEAMGGSAAPWKIPNMNYRAWSFSTMTPNASGVREPEAAGAIAWILYHAFVKTGEEKYRLGAEWAMEFLNGRTANPSYELQLPYGVYAAARMNAELGTNYNVSKLLNWCFDVGPLRSWGAILGNWGGYDVHGLIGEVSANDYAFLMNTVQHIGALAPMTRYDDRFARAIAKWVLNAANAARLFYHNYLPPENQDSEEWSRQYDANSYIGHEAIRKEYFGRSPYATGDAVAGGWGYTNLVLYASSHVGILGGIIDTTEAPMILKLDLLKTDYFHAPAYPTNLYFNPYSEDKFITVTLGDGMYDLYDAVSNQFLANGVSGAAQITIPANQAVQLVQAPAGGAITFDFNRMLIDGVVVDYRSGQAVTNHPPRIKALAANPQPGFVGQPSALYCTAEDRDSQPLTFNWSASAGQISGTGAAVTWTAPDSAGEYDITCAVEDNAGGSASKTIMLAVVDNHAPVIQSLIANPATLDVGETSSLTCHASDADDDTLTYFWYAEQGTISGTGAAVTWTAPAAQGYYTIRCVVEDTEGAQAEARVSIVVGRLAAYYPFNGSAIDESGFGNHGSVFGATLVHDRFNQPNRAFAFDGVDDFIRVPLHPTLNFETAITVSFWVKIAALLPREAFVISHGSWQNRWKLSIIPSGHLRWTAKTTSGVFDLDTRQTLRADSLYHVTVTYDGTIAKIFLNGDLNASAQWSGTILPTSFDLTIAQMLPGDNQYNLPGEIDEVRIYNSALTDQEVKALYDLPTSVQSGDVLPKATRLYANFPNPFNPRTVIRYDLAGAVQVKLKIFNLLGQEVVTLVDEPKQGGRHQVEWNGTDRNGQDVASGLYIFAIRAGEVVERRKMVLLR